MRTPGSRDCGGCRYWSEMIAQAGGGTRNPHGDLEAMCLAPSGVAANTYTRASDHCGSFAKNTLGAVDEPGQPDVTERYAQQANMKHANGAPLYAPDGTLLDDKGNRSIFDDVDE